jgi:hypothetical protein
MDGRDVSRHEAWKAWERKACRDMGGQRKPQIGPDGWARGSDDDGSLWCSLECKYLTRYQLRRSWVEQARRQGKAERRPWAIGIREHYERHSGLFICDWDTGVELAYEAGRIPLGRGSSG